MGDTPCGRSHAPAPPQVTAEEPATTAPDCHNDDIADRWLTNVRVLALDLDRPEVIDVRLEDCDVSGIVARDVIARRVEVRRSRLRGVVFANGTYDDGLIEGCRADELSMRFSRLRRVVFRDCDLTGTDFYNTTFDHVTIERCDLQRTHFDGATVNCLAVVDCNLAGISGALSLKGARLDASDLPSLAVSLAREAGIEIRDA